LCKDEQVSNWEASALSASQLHYAALDAHCLLGLLDNAIERLRLLHVRGTNSDTEDGSVWPDIGVRGMYIFPPTHPVSTGDVDGVSTGDVDGVSTADDGGDSVKDETPALSNAEVEVREEVEEEVIEGGETEEGGGEGREVMDVEGSDSVSADARSKSPKVKGDAGILPFRISLYVKNI
jgi:hypothetical protein